MTDKGMYFRPSVKETKKALIAGMRSSIPMIMLTANGIIALEQVSPSSKEAAAEWLMRLAAKYEKPIGIHIDGLTTFISPPKWTSERLQGYVAAHVDILESAFGPIDGWETKLP